VAGVESQHSLQDYRRCQPCPPRNDKINVHLNWEFGL
jgi:hypothetical protein